MNVLKYNRTFLANISSNQIFFNNMILFIFGRTLPLSLKICMKAKVKVKLRESVAKTF